MSSEASYIKEGLQIYWKEADGVTRKGVIVEGGVNAGEVRVRGEGSGQLRSLNVYSYNVVVRVPEESIPAYWRTTLAMNQHVPDLFVGFICYYNGYDTTLFSSTLHRLCSDIRTESIAEIALRFGADTPYEGKEEIVDSSTNYVVGTENIYLPDEPIPAE